MTVIEIAAIIILALTFNVAVTHYHPTELLFIFSALAAALAATEMIRGNGSVSVILPILFAASIVFGPAVGAWISLIFSVNWQELRGKIQLPSFLFNRAMFTVIGWISGYSFIAMGGNLHDIASLNSAIALGSASTMAMVVNLGFMAVALALRHDRSFREIWRVYIKWTVPGFIIMTVVGYLLVTVYVLAGPSSELIFLIPLAGIRWIFSLIKSVRYWYQHGVRVMLGALDAKDPYTFGHSMRVGQYAMVLARYMKLPEDVVEAVRNGGLLHDVGKIGTPDNILNKPGRLTLDELQVMQRHPIIGSSMLAQIHIAGAARDWVLHHHERWDGSGYPDGLFEDEIPIETRIISVVDAYDAMTSNRAYRQAMGHDDAILEIIEGSGTQFDPVVVKKFLEICEAGDLAAREGAGHGWDRISIIPEPEQPPESSSEDDGTHSGS